MATSSIQNSIAKLGASLDKYTKGAVPMDLTITLLVPYRYQARTDISEEELQELAETIREVGIFSPLLVRPANDGKYEIIAGERRWRAAAIAGLSSVPVLVKTMSDELVDKIHLYENIHRENLSTLDMAKRVQQDLDAANGDIGIVALKYGKQKPWVSRFASIAQGGELMASLIIDGATKDKAVLASVSRLERADPKAAQELVEIIKTAPEKSDKRKLADGFVKAKRDADKPRPEVAKPAKSAKKTVGYSVPEEDGKTTWRDQGPVARDPSAELVTVRLSPHSLYIEEFTALVDTHGAARLSPTWRHPDCSFAMVEFGESGLTRRAYQAHELQILSVA